MYEESELRRALATGHRDSSATLDQIVKPPHTTHRSENRVGNVEQSAFGRRAVAPRWSVTTAPVPLRHIFPLVMGIRATLPLPISPRRVLCRAI